MTATTETTTELTALADRYIAIWNERDPDARRRLIAQTWADDAEYVDPLLEGRGPDGVDAMTAGLQAQFPGLTFRRTGKVDAHHDRIRFTWDAVNGDSPEPAIAGVDFGVVTDDGRLVSITGFFDLVPDLTGGA
jgi:hypothetical protein